MGHPCRGIKGYHFPPVVVNLDSAAPIPSIYISQVQKLVLDIVARDFIRCRWTLNSRLHGLIWYIHGIDMVYTLYIHGIYMVYTWYIHGTYMV